MLEGSDPINARVAATPMDQWTAAARRAIHERRHFEAIALLERQLGRAPEDVEALCLSALARWRANVDVSTASDRLRRARTLAPGDPRVFTLSAEFSLRSGDLAAVARYAGEALAMDPDNAGALVTLARADAAGVDDERLARMRRLAGSGDLAAGRQRNVWNAVGRVLDARGEFDAAFEAFSASNRLAPGRYDRRLREERLSAAKTLFTRDFMAEKTALGAEGGDCVFIIGMPRSGSTLIEQMLSGHPDVGGCGESDALPAIDAALIRRAGNASFFGHIASMDAEGAKEAAAAYRAATLRSLDRPGARRRVDKRLSNFLSLPLLRILAPEATVLHAQRHPLDLCFACFAQDFEAHDYANDLSDLAHYHRLYQGYIALWTERLGERLVHCRYEDLSADPTAQARRIVAETGIDWRDDCAAPHRNRGFVNTASAAQVREPIHVKRVGRWRAYERHLRPLIDGLGGFSAIERAANRFV